MLYVFKYLCEFYRIFLKIIYQSKNKKLKGMGNMNLRGFVKQEGYERYLRHNTYLASLQQIWDCGNFELTGDYESGYNVYFQNNTYTVSLAKKYQRGSALKYQIFLKGKELFYSDCPEVISWIGILMLTKASVRSSINVACKEHDMIA